MTDPIPATARAAIQAELEGDTAEYRDHAPDGDWKHPNRGRSPLLTVRVAPDTLEALQAIARQRGESVSAVARMFIGDGLRNSHPVTLRSAVERLEQDLADLKARALAS